MFYYLIMQEVRSIPDDYDHYIRVVVSFVDRDQRDNPEIYDFIRGLFRSKLYNRFKQAVEKRSFELEAKFRSHSASLPVIRKMQSLKLDSNWLLKFIEEVIAKSTSFRGDLHMGNLGINNNGELRYFDPYHEDHEYGINESALTGGFGGTS